MAYEHEIAAIIAAPFAFPWRAHGLGMLKTYLDPERTVRLNLWHNRLVVPGTSPMHTHPWGLRSQIVAGRLTNRRWVRRLAEGGDPFWEGTINCESFCGIEGEPTLVYLADQEPEVYGVGRSYTQEPEEIHSTEFEDGTVTVMTRIPAPQTHGRASVFWPHGEDYGDASRDVTAEDIVETISAVRRQMRL